MVLVDTSVIIGYFKGAKGEPYTLFDELLDGSMPFGIELHIYQEVLQGTKTAKEFLNTLLFYELRDGKRSYENAAHLYGRCRRAGITIRTTIDLLIAQTALDNNLFLLHDDRDFTQMAKVVKELKCIGF